MFARTSFAGLAWVSLVGFAALASGECPDPVGQWPYAPVQAVAAVGTTAYLGSGATLVVLDISSPASPVVLGSVALPAMINKIAVAGNVAYVADGSAGLRVVDVSNPAHPIEVGHADGPAYDVAANGTRVYLAAGDLRIYDATNPASLVQTGTWVNKPPYGSWGITMIAVSGEYAFVGGTSYQVCGWAIVRVSDPALPSQVKRFDDYGISSPAIEDLEVMGNLFFTLESRYGTSPVLGIMDVSNPAAPVGLAAYDTSSATALTASGAFAFLAESTQLTVVSIADPRHPSLAGSQPLATAPAALALGGDTVLVADREGGLYLFDTSGCGAGGCSLSCTPVVPAGGVAGSAVAFQGAYLSSGCAGSPVFDWDFGDGSAHSSEQSPSHTFPFGGSFHWSVIVSLAGASCTTSGTISVASTLPPISSPGTYAYVVPTSAHKAGYNETRWVTDLVLTNPGLTDTVARLYFMKGWQDNAGSPAHAVVVPLRRSLKLTDVVANTFLESSVSGAILVGSDVPLIVTSRTYNVTDAGTFGQYVEGVPLGQALGSGTAAWLTGLAQSVTDTVGFRTNVGVVNAGAQHVRVEIALYWSDGIWLGNRSVDLNPYDFQQVDRVYAGLAPSGVDGGYALVSSATPGAALFAYASVIDNSTGDPIAVPARVPTPSP